MNLKKQVFEYQNDRVRFLKCEDHIEINVLYGCGNLAN